MQTTSFLPLSPAIKSVTIIASIIILIAMGSAIHQWLLTKQVAVLVIIIIVAVALLSCYGAHPTQTNCYAGSYQHPSSRMENQHSCR